MVNEKGNTLEESGELLSVEISGLASTSQNDARPDRPDSGKSTNTMESASGDNQVNEENSSDSSLDEVKDISSFGSIGYAWTRKGLGYSWGFGENLQLTTGDEDDENLPVELTGGRLEGKEIGFGWMFWSTILDWRSRKGRPIILFVNSTKTPPSVLFSAPQQVDNTALSSSLVSTKIKNIQSKQIYLRSRNKNCEKI